MQTNIIDQDKRAAKKSNRQILHYYNFPPVIFFGVLSEQRVSTIQRAALEKARL